MKKEKNWRRTPREYICPGCHETVMATHTANEYVIPRCARCDLMCISRQELMSDPRRRQRRRRWSEMLRRRR